MWFNYQRSRQKPDWLKIKLPIGTNYKKVKEIVSQHNLHTICTSGQCPNMGECWGRGTATFMILAIQFKLTNVRHHGNLCLKHWFIQLKPANL